MGLGAGVLDVTGDDELDPLAPVFYDGHDLDGDEETDESDGGFSDPDKLVRIWVADGRLTRVRVSPIWYRKLAGTSLESAFGHAFWLSNVQVSDQPDEDSAPTPAEEFADADFSKVPPLSAASMAAVSAALADVRRRRREALAQHRRTPAPRAAATAGSSQGVTVLLNASGHASEARFDPKWLDEAQAGHICNHTMAAAAAAYRRFVPPADETRAQLEELRQEHRYLVAGLNAMLNRRRR